MNAVTTINMLGRGGWTAFEMVFDICIPNGLLRHTKRCIMYWHADGMGGELICSFCSIVFSSAVHAYTACLQPPGKSCCVAVCGAVGQGCNEVQEFRNETSLPFSAIS